MCMWRDCVVKEEPELREPESFIIGSELREPESFIIVSMPDLCSRSRLSLYPLSLLAKLPFVLEGGMMSSKPMQMSVQTSLQ